ncbi:hypothetical protein NEOLEDRAFT_444260 [Neolentinus lepideus HHB14362 ss-1]|uniref:Uncharacterized protein n=1 Tax=Neolentinus lepideus HHB14362 ss-1 TaxID=1314782 RepID=A0A165RRJ0_9AGAM|nr:hypothetical protein NEOLEDRAFT_444260 [Neolentinus lepideus HHB14362 ss-1]
MLARDGGFVETADQLRNWMINRDRDLRERAGPVLYNEESYQDNQGSFDGGDGSARRRLKMKRSVEFALHTLKGSPSHSHSQSGSSTATVTSRERSPSASRPQALGEYTFYPRPSSDFAAPANTSERRPSLPHIYDTAPSAPRKSSTSTKLCDRRPQSAGNGAEPSPRRKLGSKYSLLSLFKKANPDGSPSESSSPPSESSSPPSSAQPAPITTSSLPTARSFSDKSPSPVDGPSYSNRFRSRYGSESTASSRMPAHVATAFEFDTASSRSRTRSGSGTSSRRNEGQGNPREGSAPSSRPGPGILKGHLRTVSSQSAQDMSGSVNGRSLRFDPNASMSLPGQRNQSPRPAAIRGNPSASPGRDSNLREYDSAGALWSGTVTASENVISLDSPPSAVESIESESAQGHAVDDDDDEEYGEVIRSGLRFRSSPAMEAKSALPEIATHSTGRSPAPALSPILSAQDMSSSPTETHFPFSLDRLPPGDVDVVAQRPGGLRVSASAGDNRLRGDSVSSMATDTSTNPPSSSSTSGTASAGINTPAIGYNPLPVTTVSLDEEYDPPEVYEKGGRALLLEDIEFGIPTKQPRLPLEIDITAISSHAQAEALVRQAQKEILEMDHVEDDSLGSAPLSAKLAAYGQSLAIERKFKEEQEKAERRARAIAEFESVRKGSLNLERTGPPRSSSRSSTHPTTPPRAQKTRRPHTAGGDESSVDHPRGPLGHARHAQGIMRSTSVHVPGHSPLAQDSEFPNSADIEIVETAATPVEDTALSSMHNITEVRHALWTSQSFDRVRSRTPDPEPERYNLDEDSLTSPIGAPLSRVSTAPCEDTLAGRSVRNRRDNAARIASANKLTRMGFVAPEGYQSSTGYSSANAGNRQRFGGLKSFVQSLKGRA